jgi:hypothetical protein
MREIKISLTLPEYNHIAILLNRNEDDGVYSGPRDQYWKRHNRILAKLLDAIKR